MQTLVKTFAQKIEEFFEAVTVDVRPCYRLRNNIKFILGDKVGTVILSPIKSECKCFHHQFILLNNVQLHAHLRSFSKLKDILLLQQCLSIRYDHTS